MSTPMPEAVRRELDRLIEIGERGALLEADAMQLRKLAESWGLKLTWRRMDLNGPQAGVWRSIDAEPARVRLQQETPGGRNARGPAGGSLGAGTLF